MVRRKEPQKGREGEKGSEKGNGTRRRRAQRRWVVPPPDSDVWPEEYRGERWKSVYAILFAGRCQLCAYSCPLPRSRQLLDKWLGVARRLLCTNHPDSPGELREVLPIDTCRNFKAKSWLPPRSRLGKRGRCVKRKEPGGEVQRIPLGHGLFATVDAADYEELKKYRWYASHNGPTIYARCRQKGKDTYMHRMIMRPRKGYIVDHIDGNGLNNRRCNLRVCTSRQNQANRGPCGGSSQFVGVFRNKDRWQAGIGCRGKSHYIGLFADEVEAAKARDRKAYELHGQYAYLNFPDDFRSEAGKQAGGRVTKVRKARRRRGRKRSKSSVSSSRARRIPVSTKKKKKIEGSPVDNPT